MSPEATPIGTEHSVVPIRATGRTPDAVSEEVEQILTERQAQGWSMTHLQPIIYNSSTTGYLLLFFTRAPGAATDSQKEY